MIRTFSYVMFAPGGGLAGKEPWGKKNIDNQMKPTPTSTPTMYPNYP